MTILKKLIPFIERMDRKIANEYLKLNSWVFYNLRGGFKCTECGAKHLRFNTGNAASTVPRNDGQDNRMLLHWYGKNGVVCPVCANQAITEIFDNYRKGNTEHVSIGTCDFTGMTNVPTIDIVWTESNSLGINVRFGKGWWNGFHASQYAFEQGIKNCQMESTMSTYIDKKLYYNAGNGIIHKSRQSYDDFYKKNFT